jgi:SAM-dependent methyltransferase
MRTLPFRDGSFDGVTSLFTSFGYFSAAEDRAVLTGCARVLRPRGFLLLDFLNREFVLAHHKPRSQRREGAYRILEERRLTRGESRAIKRVRIYAADAQACLADYEERVNLYRSEELRAWLAQSGLSVQREWGDYDGSRFVPERSPRHVLLGAKESP